MSVTPSSSAPKLADGKDSATNQLLNTPSPVLHLLAHAAPGLRAATACVQALNWTHPNPWLSFLLLASYWLLVLFGDVLLRFGVNALLLFLLAYGWLAKSLSKTPSRPPRDRVLTPERYLQVLEDARELSQALQTLVDKFIAPAYDLVRWRNPALSISVAAYLVTSYPLYLLFVYCFGPKPLLLLVGTVAFLSQARFVKLLHGALARSLLVRSTFYFLSAVFLGGGRHAIDHFKSLKRLQDVLATDIASPLESQQDQALLAATALTADDVVFKEDDQKVVFTFTIFENQRWWLGLEWTQALMPNERPPWCDLSLKPIDPPSAFLLPAPQVTLVPAPTRSDPGAQIRRTTKWQWIDADWRVLPDHRSATPIHASSALTVDMSRSKSLTNPSSAQPSAAALAEWARNKANQASADARKDSPQASQKRRSSWSPFQAQGEGPDGAESAVEEADARPLPRGVAFEDITGWVADGEGWQYGDNAWEKMTNKAGMGKYTRRRVWRRRAQVAEESEIISTESGLRARSVGVNT